MSVRQINMDEGSSNKFSYAGQQDGPLSSMPKGAKAIGSRTKKNKVQESIASLFTGSVPKPTDRKKAGIKVSRKNFQSIKDYKVKSGEKVDYDALRVQKEGHWDDQRAKTKSALAKHEKAMIKSAKKSVKKYDSRKYVNGKPEGFSEDARYDSTVGGMEWGTDKGDNYYRSLTPGQTPKNRKTPIKPLPIKARKPEDEKAGGKYKGFKEEFDLSHIEDKQADHSKHQYPINNEVETHDTGDKGHWLTGKDGDWYIEQDDITELDKEAENFSFKDAVSLGLYDDDELTYDDYDNTPGFDNETEITEALSVQGRLKRRFNARRNKQKLRVARRIALRRGSTPDRLKKRATRGARLMVYKRLLRGRDRAGLPPAEKARLERMITRFQPLVSRISIKLLPQMRQNEIKRLTSRGKMKAKSSKKFKAAKAVKSASQKRTKKFKIPKGKYKAPKKKAAKSYIKSGGPTIKKASKAYKAFSYSVG